MSSTDLDAPKTGAEDQDVKSSAESSEAEGVETPGFSDAVLAALDKPETEAAPATEVGKEKSDPESESKTAENASKNDEEADSGFTEDELKEFKHHTSTRIRQLVEQKNTAREEATTATAELKALQPKIEQFDGLVNYMRENNIESSEFDNALKIVNLIKNDQAKAFEVLTPIYRSLAEQVGKILPEDLQQRVAQGHLSEDDARQLHESRSHVKLADQRQERQAERTEAGRQEVAQNARLQTVVKAADDWTKAKAASDPDWSLKQNLVAEQVELDINRRVQQDGPDGFPKSMEEVVEMSEKALKLVESRLKALGPRPKEKKVVTQDSAAPRMVAEAGSVEQAMEQALGN